MLKKIFASLILAAGLCSAVSLAAVNYTFSDVNSDTDYQAAIYWAADRGIATGYGNGMWGPDECVRRAELMKMVMEFNGTPIATKTDSVSKFSDVLRTDWFYTYVTLANSYGYIDGYADGTFKPNACVNRAEAMKIAVNVLIEKNPTSWPTTGLFYDDKLIVDMDPGSWYIPYAYRLFKDRLVGTNHTISAGYVGGLPTIKFFPDESMSRAEVVEMLYRIGRYIGAR